MPFTLEILPAQEGDCLLLHYGSKTKPRVALIDGGPSRVYEETLRPRLDDLAAAASKTPFELDLVMVSHIDADHITGVRKLFRQLEKELSQSLPMPIRVNTLWHNTFNDILSDPSNAYYKTFTAAYTASADGSPDPNSTTALEGELTKKGDSDPSHTAFDIASVLASQGDGRALRDMFKALFDARLIGPLNHPIKKGGKPTLISAEEGVTSTVKLDNISVQIVGPLREEIEALQEAFDKELAEKGLNTASLVAAYADDSIPNLSSIVCLVSSSDDGEERSILLTGDARGDHILTGLETAGLLASDAPLSVDVLKVPHHGSSRNVEPAFFERVIADTYVFSGNGKHGNPDRETLEMLMDARGKGARYQIVLTYTAAETDKVAKAEALSKHRPWTRGADSVADLITKRKADGYAFEVIEGAPVKIDLGAEAIDW